MADKSRLEKITEIALLVAIVIVVATYAKIWLAPKPGPSALPEEYKVGDTVKSDLKPSANGGLILYVSQNCHFCTASMPFYQELVKKMAPGQGHLLIVSRDSREDLNKYLQSHEIVFSNTRSVSEEPDVKMMRTPAIYQVDSRGVIVNLWLGQLSEANRAVVLKFATE